MTNSENNLLKYSNKRKFNKTQYFIVFVISLYFIVTPCFSNVLNLPANDAEIKQKLIDSTAIKTTAQSKQTIDSSKIQKKDKDSALFVPIKDFMYANNQRYMIDGSLPYESTHIKPLTAIVVGSVYTGIFVVQHEMQQNTIWKKVGKFHVEEDAQYTMYLDKAGHFFGTYMASYVFSEALMTSGLSYDAASVWGGALGLAYTGYVEVLDGYSVDFGFSPSDFYADIAGASFFVAQHYFPVLQNFTPKFMYAKPSWHGEINRVDADSFIDDYSSQIFFMSMNVHNLLPDNMKKYWPEWLELSVGYAVFSICAPGNDCTKCNGNISEPRTEYMWGNQKLIISLDYNLAKILPDGPPWWNWLRQSMNMFKLPSLEIGRHSTHFRLLYPFQFELGGIKF
jgi:hypothetical protein